MSLASNGTSAFALAAEPNGDVLYAATWRWDDAAVGRRGQGDVLALNAITGAVLTPFELPAETAVTDLALTVSGAGKVYVADIIGDRLWRVDTRTDTLLGALPMPGAPLALAARQG